MMQFQTFAHKKHLFLTTFSATVLLFVFFMPKGTAAQTETGIETKYLYHLSNFNGPIHSTWAGISVDETRNEIYIVDRGEVLVFNDVGMEVYRFGGEGTLGMIEDVAVDMAGDVLVLSRIDRRSTILRCDYRGTFVSELQLTELPPDFSNLEFRYLAYQNGSLYLVDPFELKIVVTDETGVFQYGYNLRDLIQTAEKPPGGLEIDGFSVDPAGNMLFTIPVLFAAYGLSPDGGLSSFGAPGSGPGRFNLAAGIVADERGYVYVADRLKSVVQVFSSDFKFLTQFGYRGLRPGNILGPKQLAIDSRNRLYVSQLRERGISVFQIRYPEP